MKDDKIMRDVPQNVRDHKLICDKLNETYEAKNNDYGGAIEKGINELGWVYLTAQLWNKLERFKTLTTKDTTPKVNESLEDTLMDMATYAVEGARILQSKVKEDKS